MTDQDTYTKAPSVPDTVSLFDEANPTLFVSKLVYSFVATLDKCRDHSLVLDFPEDFPVKDMSRFFDESMDLTEYNNGNGLSFADISNLMTHSKEAFVKAFGDDHFLESVTRNIKESLGNPEDDESTIYLTHLRSIQQSVACVYGVVKDTVNKRIIVTFRGSSGFVHTTRDWQTNLNAVAEGMRTPKKIKDKMKGVLQKRVLVHKGFYDYLFHNERMDGKQRYDEIIDDIEAAINGEKGYSVYITGHSLGGALATMFSFKLAGAGKRRDNIPRPITCITWAAPFSGTSGYRTAFENLERSGFLRCLRVNNAEDIVPTIPNFSFLRLRTMKQVGINLRLTSTGCSIQHSSNATFWTSCRNSIFKPVWAMMKWHGLLLHEERFTENANELKKLKFDDMYKDENIVSKAFKEDNIA